MFLEDKKKSYMNTEMFQKHNVYKSFLFPVGYGKRVNI